jgi:hypothetical protein
MGDQLLERVLINEDDELFIYNNHYFRKPDMYTPILKDFKADPSCRTIHHTKAWPNCKECETKPFLISDGELLAKEVTNAIKSDSWRRRYGEFFSV